MCKYVRLNMACGHYVDKTITLSKQCKARSRACEDTDKNTTPTKSNGACSRCSAGPTTCAGKPLPVGKKPLPRYGRNAPKKKMIKGAAAPLVGHHPPQAGPAAVKTPALKGQTQAKSQTHAQSQTQTTQVSGRPGTS